MSNYYFCVVTRNQGRLYYDRELKCFSPEINKRLYKTIPTQNTFDSLYRLAEKTIQVSFEFLLYNDMGDILKSKLNFK